MEKKNPFDEMENTGISDLDQMIQEFRSYYEELPEDQRKSVKENLEKASQVCFELPLCFSFRFLTFQKDDGDYESLEFSPRMLFDAVTAWDKGECYTPLPWPWDTTYI